MNLEQLGSLGDFISSIGVVLSLIYVALQLKQNTVELKRAAFRDIFQSYTNIHISVYTDTGIASLLVKAQANSAEITAEDALKLDNYYNERLFCTVQLMNAVSEGQVEYTQKAWSATISRLVYGLDSKCFREYWLMWKNIYPARFIAQLDTALAEAGTQHSQKR